MSMTNNKRLARNTILLYIRTVIVLVLSLYISRLILEGLGTTDLGIYNVVGGIVTLLSFFQNAQTNATGRFITYELGLNTEKRDVSRVFSVCTTIHVLLAGLILLLGETIGLWAVNNIIFIPDDRAIAANFVYQFALFTFVLNVIKVPFNAVIIAHERMSIFAYFSIIEVMLKLLLAILLPLICFDRLIIYSICLSLVALIVLLCNICYLRLKLQEYKFSLTWDSQYSFKILSFSGWTMLGSSTNAATQQGVSLLMNNFVGLIANTALGFANQVNQAVNTFVASFTTAFSPQVIKYYASGEYSALHLLMNRASKFSFSLAYLIALPAIFNMELLLNIWLTKVPMYTCEFCQLILICTVIDATTGVYNTAITASGKIKYYQLFISVSFALDVICSFVMLFNGIKPEFVFASRILTRGLLNMIIGLVFAKKLVQFNLNLYFKNVMIPILFTLIVSIIPNLFIVEFYDGFLRLILSTLISTIVVVLSIMFVIMTQEERNSIGKVLKQQLYFKIVLMR